MSLLEKDTAETVGGCATTQLAFSSPKSKHFGWGKEGGLVAAAAVGLCH